MNRKSTHTKTVLVGLVILLGDAGYMNGIGRENFLDQILISGEDWQLVGKGYRFSEGTTVDRNGTVYFNDIQASKGYRLEGNSVVEWCSNTNKALGQTFGVDGQTLFTVSWGVPQVIKYSADGERTIYVSGTLGNDIVCHPSGNLYITNPPGINADEQAVSRIWLIRPDKEQITVHKGIRFTNGIALSPDGKTLYVNDWRGRHVYRFPVIKDGLLGEPDQFIKLVKPEGKETAGPDGMRVDSQGRIWVTTLLGIQVFDDQGRPLGILDGPEDRQSHLVFGGPDFDTLYLTTAKAVYKRRLRVRGVNPWDPADDREKG